MEQRSSKPCSVLDNNLSMHMHAISYSFLIDDFPYQIWVSRLWGLPTFHFLVSNYSSLWHFQRIIMTCVLDYYLAVIRSCIPDVIFSISAITTIISDCASMDFPLPKQLLPGPLYLMLFGFIPCFHKNLS